MRASSGAERPRKPALWLSRRRLVQSCLLAASVAGTARAEIVAVAPVERLHAALLDAPSSGASAAERQRVLKPLVAQVFDFETMSRAAVGATWSDLSGEQRVRLADAFAGFAAANYATGFGGASGIAFETLGTRAADGGRSWVETQLVRPDDPPVRFDYLVQPSAAGPRIVNVVVDGALNELARRRDEFRALLDAGGIDRLLEVLEQRTAQAMG